MKDLLRKNNVDDIFNRISFKHYSYYINYITYGEIFPSNKNMDPWKKTSIISCSEFIKKNDKNIKKWNNQMAICGIKMDVHKYRRVFYGCMNYHSDIIDTNAFNKSSLYSSTYMIDDILDSNLHYTEKNNISEHIRKFLVTGEYTDIKCTPFSSIINNIIASFAQLFPFKENQVLYQTFLYLHEAQNKEKMIAERIIHDSKITIDQEIEWYTLISLKELYSKLTAYAIHNQVNNIGCKIIKILPYNQLRDDMEDIHEDILNKSVTPFNLEYLSNKKMLQSPIEILEKQLFYLREEINDVEHMTPFYFKLYESMYEASKTSHIFAHLDVDSLDYIKNHFNIFRKNMKNNKMYLAKRLV
jgi:hypothetical protein